MAHSSQQPRYSSSDEEQSAPPAQDADQPHPEVDPAVSGAPPAKHGTSSSEQSDSEGMSVGDGDTDEMFLMLHKYMLPHLDLTTIAKNVGMPCNHSVGSRLPTIKELSRLQPFLCQLFLFQLHLLSQLFLFQLHLLSQLFLFQLHLLSQLFLFQLHLLSQLFLSLLFLFQLSLLVHPLALLSLLLLVPVHCWSRN
ncbi:unnamed protein product [Boreogadus saida]